MLPGSIFFNNWFFFFLTSFSLKIFSTYWTDLGSKINMNWVALFFFNYYLSSYGQFCIQRQKCNEIMKLCLNWVLHWLHQTPKTWVGSLSKEEYTQFLAHQKRVASSFASTSELVSASHCLLCSIFDPWVIGF